MPKAIPFLRRKYKKKARPKNIEKDSITLSSEKRRKAKAADVNVGKRSKKNYKQNEDINPMAPAPKLVPYGRITNGVDNDAIETFAYDKKTLDPNQKNPIHWLAK